MSLTSFIAQSDVRRRFAQEFNLMQIKRSTYQGYPRECEGFVVRPIRGNMVLIANSVSYVQASTFEEVMLFLKRQSRKKTFNVFCDLTKAVKGIFKFKPALLRQLEQKREVTWEKYRLGYAPSQFLRITKNHHSVYFFDLGRHNPFPRQVTIKGILRYNPTELRQLESKSSLKTYQGLHRWVKECQSIASRLRTYNNGLLEKYHLPELQKKQLLAPPQTANYGLVGTAFDYLMRFYLKSLNPKAHTQGWVAEIAVDTLSKWGRPDVENPSQFNLDCRKLGATAANIVKNAKVVYEKYLNEGEFNTRVIKSALLLGQLDAIARSGYFDFTLGQIDKGDIKDLKRLVSLVNPSLFKANELCYLNPTFGEGSELVGGADADLLIDDTLIEIKTKKDLEFTQRILNQLLGYYVLAKIGGVAGCEEKPLINHLGIYYARHGELYTFPVKAVVDERRLSAFIKWFKERAESQASCTLPLKFFEEL